MLAIQTNKDAVMERPILFTWRIVRKILSGEKTNTRRIMNPQPVFDPAFSGGWVWKTKRADTAIASINDGRYPEACPWAPGSRLWVRESFVVGQRMKGWKPELDEQGDEKLPAVWYRADDNEDLLWTDEHGTTSFEVPWKPSIHMPRWACRLVLELVSVRVERLQDISEEDAKAEGAEIAPGDIQSPDNLSYRGAFAFMWNEINGERGSWSDNPWVWVLELRRICEKESSGGRG